MIKIDDVISQLWITKEKLDELYFDKFGKKLSARSKNIADEDFSVLQKVVGKKWGSVEQKESTVLKGTEFWGDSGFLSGLGFGKIDQEPAIGNPKWEDEKVSKDNTWKSVVIRSPQEILEESMRKEKKDAIPDVIIPTVKRSDDNFFGGHTGRGSNNRNWQRNTRSPRRGDSRHRVSGNTTFSQGKLKPSHTSPSHTSWTVHNKQQEQAAPTSKRVKKIATTSENLKKKEKIIIWESINVKEFSEKMGIVLPELMKVMMKNGIMMWINASLDFDMATLIGEEFNVDVQREEKSQMDLESFLLGDLKAIIDEDKQAKNSLSRAPIVTVMGHVDHGKTTLLDYLRNTNVADGEAWGITQSIGASVVDYEGNKITFIDTPGHELFTTLRARGAKLTNIAVIVVAADDSVMPQTIESINHAKEADIPIIIAVTKIDKPWNDMEKIKSDLATHGITPEDWWGDSPIIGVSGITGQGIPELLETILLHTEMLELKYNPDRPAVGVVVDAYTDPKQGVISNVIVMSGTLKIGDIVVAYNTYGKVRRMQNFLGQNVKAVKGWEPVQILGISNLPEAGRMVEVVKTEKEAVNKIGDIKKFEDDNSTKGSALKDFLQNLWDENDTSELNLILKSDGLSSLDALKQAVAQIKLPENVVIKTVHSDVGYFSDSDLSLAQVSKSLLLGFNISVNASFKKKADNLKVEVKNFDIIYELTDYIDGLVKGMIKIEEEEVVVGKMEVLALFYTTTKEMIIWGKITEWKVTNMSKFRLMRGDEILSNGEILSLQKNKDQVKEVIEGDECGIKVRTGKKIQEGDVLEFYEMQEKK